VSRPNPSDAPGPAAWAIILAFIAVEVGALLWIVALSMQDVVLVAGAFLLLALFVALLNLLIGGAWALARSLRGGKTP
jgi:hypothetical protein